MRSAVENLKAFVNSRPPLVVFLVFMTALAGTLLSLSYWLNHNDKVRHPDIALDWNVFLESFSKVDFCVNSIRNGTSFPSFNVSEGNGIPRFGFTSDPTASASLSRSIKRYSIRVYLVIHPTHEFLEQSNNLTHLSGSIYGFQLGLQGDAATARLSVSFELGRNKSLNESLCNNHVLLGRLCPTIYIPTCVHVAGSVDAFPATPNEPARCEAAPSTPDASLEIHAAIEAHREIASQGWGAIPFCPRGPVVHTKFKLDPALTVFLNAEDRSVINLHLLHTSYFLVVMVVTVLCYAMVKGHGPKVVYSAVTT